MDHSRRQFLYRLFKTGAVLTATQQAWAGDIKSVMPLGNDTPGQDGSYPAHANDSVNATWQGRDISGATVRTMTGAQPLHQALDDRVVSVATVDLLQALPTDHLEEGAQAWVAGYHVPGDGGGGLFTLLVESSERSDEVIYITGTGQKLWRRSHQGVFTSAQAGIKRDGTREDEAIQRAINVAFDRQLSLHLSAGPHTHGGMILIPHDVVITGCGMHVSYFYNDYRDAGQRGVVVGTYGPANSYIPAYHPEYVYPLSHTADNKLYVKNALDFKVGDIIGIEGTQPVRDTNLYSPNQINEVVSVHKDHIVVGHVIDDDYEGGRVIRLNQPKLLDDKKLIDATGRRWNLHVSVNTKISDVGFRHKGGLMWPSVNLSTYKTSFEKCSFGSLEGRYSAVAGNPVARTLFKDCEFLYSRNAWEFAYYSHDVEIVNPTILRVQGVPSSSGDYICHANTSEGAKRIHVDGGYLNDGGPNDGDFTVLQTGPESSIRNFTLITFARGVWGDSQATMSGCTIMWGQEFGIAGFSSGYANDNVIISQREASGAAILVDKGTFKNNVLRSVNGSKRSVDVLKLANRHATRPNEDSNETFRTTPAYYRTYSNSLSATNGQVIIGSLEIPVGTIEQDSAIAFEAMIEIPHAAIMEFLLNDHTIYGLKGEKGIFGLKGRIIFASGNGMDDKYCRFFLNSTSGGYEAQVINTGVRWSDVEKMEVQVAGFSKEETFRCHYVRIERAGY